LVVPVSRACFFLASFTSPINATKAPYRRYWYRENTKALVKSESQLEPHDALPESQHHNITNDDCGLWVKSNNTTNGVVHGYDDNDNLGLIVGFRTRTYPRNWPMSFCLASFVDLRPVLLASL
jgi:hypothetical protein